MVKRMRLTSLSSLHTASRTPVRHTRSITSSCIRHDAQSHLPRVAKPTFWASLIPKPFRQPTSPLEAAERQARKAERAAQPRTRNEYISFIVLALIVGSNAINMIALRNETRAYRLKTDAKLHKLQDVIRRVKAGEKVDVRKELGTGDKTQEAEWAQMLEELANHDAVSAAAKRRELQALESASAAKRNAAEKSGEPVSESRSDGGSSRPKYVM